MQMEQQTGDKDVITETEKVYRHRTVCFIVLGYSLDEAEVLAGTDVDHHQIERLIAKGCDLQVAARICM